MKDRASLGGIEAFQEMKAEKMRERDLLSLAFHPNVVSKEYLMSKLQ